MNWFETWFDTKYYHLLYKHRDGNEAKKFLDVLIKHIHASANYKILDAPCGKGRHSIYLNSLGYDVTGLDLSACSITEAKKYESNNLHFFVHDMRSPFKKEAFDLALNLFTSIGYFENETDDLAVIESAYTNLKKGGLLVVDYFNPNKVCSNLVINEEKEIDGISFTLHRKLEGNFICKEIKIIDSGNVLHFNEKVRLISIETLKNYFTTAGFKVESIFGDYLLNSYDTLKSDRLILLGRKI